MQVNPDLKFNNWSKGSQIIAHIIAENVNYMTDFNYLLSTVCALRN